jgi:hypothetical protein
MIQFQKDIGNKNNYIDNSMAQSRHSKKVKYRPIIPIKPISEIYQEPIIKSHIKFSDVFDQFMINRLNAWFKNNGKVTDFVREERRENGLDEIDTTVESFVYGTSTNDTTLVLLIKKHGNDFIHLSIHLAPEYLSTSMKNSGIIHIVKNIYKSKLSGKKNYHIKSIYAITQPKGKHHSLHFEILQRYSTSTIVKNVNIYDEEVKQEMKVITKVLNKLFDEDDIEHYVGDYHAIHPNSNKIQSPTPMEPNTNNIIRNINTRTKFISRRNIHKQGGRYKTKKNK